MDSSCPNCRRSHHVRTDIVERCPTCGRLLGASPEPRQPPALEPMDPAERLALEAQEAEEAAMRLALDRKWAQKLLEEQQAAVVPLGNWRLVLFIAWPLFTALLHWGLPARWSDRDAGVLGRLGESVVGGLWFAVAMVLIAYWGKFALVVYRRLRQWRRQASTPVERTQADDGL
jgi:hypothetical protein